MDTLFVNSLWVFTEHGWGGDESEWPYETETQADKLIHSKLKILSKYLHSKPFRL